MSFQRLSERNIYVANDIKTPQQLLTSLQDCAGYKSFSARNIWPSSLQLDGAACERLDLASLQFLSLIFNVDYMPGYSSIDAEADQQGQASSICIRRGRLSQIISRAPNLQEITIKFKTSGYFYKHYPARFQDILPSTGLQNLTALQLENVCCHTKDIIQFLTERSKMMMEIRLHSMAFVGDPMRDVFLKLSELGLRDVELTGTWKYVCQTDNLEDHPQMEVILFDRRLKACGCRKNGNCLGGCACLAGNKCINSMKCLRGHKKLGRVFRSHILAGLNPGSEYSDPWPDEFVP